MKPPHGRRRWLSEGALAAAPQPVYMEWLDHTTANDELPTWVGRGAVVPEEEAHVGGAVVVQSNCYVFEEHDKSFVIAHSVSADPCDGRWEAVQTFIVVKSAVIEWRPLASQRGRRS